MYENCILLISKQEKDHMGKENYKPVSFMDSGVKILNKILATQIQQHMKIFYDQVGFTIGMQRTHQKIYQCSTLQ